MSEGGLTTACRHPEVVDGMDVDEEDEAMRTTAGES